MAVVANQIAIVASLQDNLSRPVQKIEKSTARLEKQFTKLSGAFQNAFQFYVRFRIFGLINRAIGSLEGAIPGLIKRGQEWQQTVDSVADSSGLAAEKASLLTGIVKVMTGNTDGLTKALGALSQQVTNQGDVLRRYGIETKNANGELLDSWTILNNVRNALSDAGNGFITTAAARDLFARGGQTMMDFLTMTDRQFRMLTQDVKESGVVMTEAARIAADQWGRTKERLDTQITGIANQIVTGVQPLLTKLVDGITGYLRANMAQIVGFVVEVVATVANFIAGFLGIDLALDTFAEKMDAVGAKNAKRERQLSKAAKTRPEQASTEDAFTEALSRQIAAIDRQLAAMARVEKAEDARREQARILREISDARKELRDLRGKSVFAAGMSAAEAELARQAQAGDIIAAQKNIADAEKRLAEQRSKAARDNRRQDLLDRKTALQTRLADYIKTLAKQAQADREALSQALGADKGGVGITSNIRKVLDEVAKRLKVAEIGKKWGEEFRASVDGILSEFTDPDSGLGSRIAGLIAKLEEVRAMIGDWIKFLSPSAESIVETTVDTAGKAGSGFQKFTGIDPVAAAVGFAALVKVFSMAAALKIAIPALVGLAAYNSQKDNPVNTEKLSYSPRDAFVRQYAPFLLDVQGGLQGIEKGIGDAIGNIFGSPVKAAAMPEDIAASKENLAILTRNLSPAGTAGKDLDAIAANTRGLNTSLPWGIATVNLIVDKRVLLTLAGIPIIRGTSTTRVSPSQP